MPRSVTSGPLFKIALALGITSLVIMPLNLIIFFNSRTTSQTRGTFFLVVFLLAFAQFTLGAASAICALVQFARSRGLAGREWSMVLAVLATLIALGAVVGGIVTLGLVMLVGF